MTKKTLKISLRVILLFIVAMLTSLLSEYLRSFFGDWKCIGSGNPTNNICNPIYQYCNYGEYGFHKSTWHWGYRHWLYLIMCIVLFIIQVIDLFSFMNDED